MRFATRLPEFDTQIPLLRPLLALTRAETEAHCAQHNLNFRVDSSNTDLAYLRNRLRHELLPQLESYNPRIRQGLARTALTLQGDFELLEEILEDAWRGVVVEIGRGFVAFGALALQQMSTPLRRNLLRKAAQTLQPNLRNLDFAALERAAILRPGLVDLAGGLRLFPEQDRFYMATWDADLPNCDFPQLSQPFELTPGEFALGERWVLRVSLQPVANPVWLDNPNPFWAWLDAGLTGENLRVRLLRPGDRFEPLGMPGQHVKLSDLFTNLKIPQRQRANWPLVCVGDQVAWLPGLRLAHPWRITPITQQAWQLSLTRI